MGICCDRCAEQLLAAAEKERLTTMDHNDDERPHTPVSQSESFPGSPHSTPSKTTNRNGKRVMTHDSRSGPATRRGEHLKNVRSALENWRFKIKMCQYSPGPFLSMAILPDKTLTTLASNARIKTIDDMKEVLNPPWIFVERHGQEVLDMLKRLDEADKEDRERTKADKKAAKRRETEARREETKRQKELERGWAKTQRLGTPSLAGSSNFNRVVTHQTTSTAGGNQVSRRIFFSFLNLNLYHRQKCHRYIIRLCTIQHYMGSTIRTISRVLRLKILSKAHIIVVCLYPPQNLLINRCSQRSPSPGLNSIPGW